MRDDLQTRARSAKLSSSGTVGTPGPELEILAAAPCDERGRNQARWRTIDLWSDEGLPWQARIEWSGGHAGARSAYITVSKSTRVCIHAASVRVTGRGLSTTNQTAWAAVSDGQTTTENEYSERGSTAVGTTTMSVAVPPFAKYVRLELATFSEYALSFIALTDGWAVVRNTTRGDAQPSPGLPVGDAQTVTLTTTNPVDWRITFVLNL